MGIDFAKSESYSLIVALDCGIKAIDKVDYANEKGNRFIICDHHRPAINFRMLLLYLILNEMIVIIHTMNSAVAE